MSDDEKLRRALREVADSTAAAAKEPPALGGATVVPLAPRRRRTERWVLGGVAAAVVLVAALLAGVLAGDDGDGDDTVEVADDPTTSTTDEPRSTTTSSSSTTTETTATTATSVPGPTATTAVAVPPDRRLLASGAGWTVERTEGPDGSCVTIITGRSGVGDCTFDLASAAPDRVRREPLADGRTVLVVPAGDATTVEAFGADGILMPSPSLVADPFLTSERWLVTDAAADILLLRDGEGGPWVAGIYGGRLRTDSPAFGDEWSGYQRATGSLSFDRYMELGGYYGPDGRCAVARQVAPEPAILGTACLTDGAEVAATLVPTVEPGYFDIVGIAMSVGDWRCVLPDGGSCGSNRIAGIAGFGGIVAQQGPLVIDGATEVTIETDNASVTIAVPAG